MESSITLPEPNCPEELASRVLESMKISGPLVHTLSVAKEHCRLQVSSDLEYPYLLYQNIEREYVLHLNEFCNEFETRFACALAIGSLFVTKPVFSADTSTNEDQENRNSLIYRFALAFVIHPACLAADCADREITPGFIDQLIQRYGVPKVIMENCLVHRGYLKRELAPAPEGYFADFIPRRFRLSS